MNFYGADFGYSKDAADGLSEKFGSVLDDIGFDFGIGIRINFDTKVKAVSSLDDLVLALDCGIESQWESISNCYILEDPADSIVLVDGFRAPIFQTNADCSIITILNKASGDLAVMHGALANVDNDDGSSIVTNTIDWFLSRGAFASDLSLWAGCGAMSCCYGHTDGSSRYERLRDLYGESVVGIVSHGPRVGAFGYSPGLIACEQARLKGVVDVECDEVCTSCASGSDEFFSNLRGDKKRNLGVVYW